MLQGKSVLKTCASLGAAAIVLFATAAPQAQQRAAAPSRVTSPTDQFGQNIGDDYFLVNYTQYLEYLKKLDAQSERMMVVDIGKTEEGRAEVTAIITSPENHRKLPLIKEANRKLALADGLTDEQARQLARDGKTVVWIDGGLHATEVLGAQQLIETIYRLNTKTDPETLRILNDDDHPVHAGQPGRHGARVELVHARVGREEALDRRHSAAVSEIHRPRRQPRLLHDEHVGERQREPDDVSRVVPGHHVQPSPDRAGRRGAVRAAVPRSVQLQLRSARRARHRHGGRGDPHAAGGRRKARRRDAVGDELLDVVQRRHPDDVVLPQSDRHPDRNDRQPDAGRDPVRPRHAAAARRRAESDSRRARGISGRRSSTR